MSTANYSGDPTDVTDDTPFDALKGNALKTAGISYLIGDGALITSKLMEGGNTGAKGALLWGAGGLAAARYGNPSAEKQLQLLSHHLGAYLKKQGIQIPNNPTTAELAKEGGLIDHIESFLYTYPSQMLNIAYAAGGALMVREGMHSANQRWDMASGALVVAGALAGLLIPEKKPDPEHKPEGALGKAWQWVQEKPLRASGTFYHLNNIAMIGGAFSQRVKNQPSGSLSHWPRFLTATSYIFANTMLFLSSKLHQGGEKTQHELMGKLAEASAQVIAAQPSQSREALVQQISGYLSSQPEITLKTDAIAQILHAKLDGINPSPATLGWQQQLQPDSTPSLTR